MTVQVRVLSVVACGIIVERNLRANPQKHRTMVHVWQHNDKYQILWSRKVPFTPHTTGCTYSVTHQLNLMLHAATMGAT